MSKLSLHQGSVHIIYDAEIFKSFSAEYFDRDWLAEHKKILGGARGRGTTLFFADAGGEFALRRCLRGGLVGKVLHDRYLRVPLEQTRPWSEWRILDHLRAAGVAVPTPAGAMVSFRGLWYRAFLITRKISDTVSLAGALERGDAVPWDKIGKIIADMHRAGIWHADLNAHNILLRGDEVFLIDFDRGAFCCDPQRLTENLDRLRRSLTKLARLGTIAQFPESFDRLLLPSYREQI